MLEQSALASAIIQYFLNNSSSNYSNTDRKILSIPLQFGDLVTDILSKQFTKLNNNHRYRIHYLGPRFPNTNALHKKYAYSENSPLCQSVADRQINKYTLDCKKIVTSFLINQKLRNNHYYKTGLYYRAFQGMNPTLDLSQEFIFNGRFQSGNLDCVIQYKPRQFDCFLKIDSNTRGHIQWYNFSVKNGIQQGKIKINICNIAKPGTLYEQGMHPYVFSKQYFSSTGTNWSQGNKFLTNVNFGLKAYNYSILENKIPDKAVYCLSFEYQFEYENDEVYFAYCIPYSYSEMLHDISHLPKQYCKIHNFAKSLTGVEIPMLQVTENTTKQSNSTKQNIIITGRIHPAETNGSHMLKGFMEFLCSNDRLAAQFRNGANIFIIPMINPDGVIIGNSRTSAAGRDLNRMFPLADNELFPQIYQLKQFIKRFTNQKQILLYYDFHGHSRKKNTFFYGPAYPIGNLNYYKCRVLPKIIENFNNAFRYYSCSFSISQSKKATGRACMFQNYQIPYTYTIESSIGSYYDSEKMKTFLFDKQAWQNMGMSICQGTAKFMEAYQEYQSLLRERRAVRESKKAQRFSINKRSIKGIFQDINIDQEPTNLPTVHQPLKIYYTPDEGGLFLKIIKQIKESTQQKKQPESKQLQIKQEEDLSSDDHDENEDFDITKMKEFANLMTEKEKPSDISKNKKIVRQKIYSKNDSVLRSGSFSVNNYPKDQQDQIKHDEELNLFKEVIMRKIQSSHSKGRPTSNSKVQIARFNRRAGIKTNSCTSQQKNQSSYDLKNEDSIRLNLKQNFRGSSVSQTRPAFIHRTYRGERNIQPTQFSQIQFPDNNELPKTTKNGKADAFRRIRKIRFRQDNKDIYSLNCSEMKVTKLQKSENKQSELKEPKDIKTNNIQLKISQLMTNLQYRSKVLKQSVKYRDIQKKKQKNILVFPSSFQGIRTQVNTKRRQLHSRENSQDKSSRKYDQSPLGVKMLSNIQIE